MKNKKPKKLKKLSESKSPKFSNNPINQKLICLQPIIVTIDKYFSTEIFRNFYLGHRDSDPERKVFIKLKDRRCLTEIELTLAEYENYKLVEMLKREESCRLPQCLLFGSVGVYEGIAMELLGPSVQDLWERNGMKMSLVATAHLAQQLIILISFLHDLGFLYRNVQPDHFLYGLSGTEKWSSLYVIDLKHCLKWNDSDALNFNKKNEPLAGGHIRFRSINTHRRLEQSRRDDLESLGYMLIYLHSGTLPWYNLQWNLPKPEQNDAIASLKSSDTVLENLPDELRKYLSMVKCLTQSDNPDYHVLGDIFSDLTRNRKIEELYDWDQDHKSTAT